MRLAVLAHSDLTRLRIKRCARSRGHEVSASVTVAELLEVLSHESVEAAVVDIDVPDVDCIMVIRTIVSMYRLPVVAFSERQSANLSDRAVLAGAHVAITRHTHSEAMCEAIVGELGGDRHAGRPREPAL